VLAEHHLELSKSYYARQRSGGDASQEHIGIIFPRLNVERSIVKCARLLKARPRDRDAFAGNASWPDVRVEGHRDTSFSYIKEHME
jgi:hypothetical protein